HVVAGTFSGLYDSRDGGAHWAPAGFTGQVIVALGAAAPNELWVALVHGDDDHQIFEIHHTQDGGATWISTGWPARRAFSFLSFRFDSRAPDKPYVIADGRVFHRTAAGWDRLASADHSSDLVAL